MGFWKDLKNLFKASSKKPRDRFNELNESTMGMNLHLGDELNELDERSTMATTNGSLTGSVLLQDTALSSKEYDKKLDSIQGKIDECINKNNQAEKKLDTIKAKTKENSNALKGVDDSIASKNNDLSKLKAQLETLSKLYTKTKEGPNIIKGKEGKVTKDAMLKKVGEKLNDLGTEYKKVGSELEKLFSEKGKLTEESKNLTKDEKEVNTEIKQLKSEYNKLKIEVRTVAEKSDKQFDSELSSITESLKKSNVSGSSKFNEKITNIESVKQESNSKINEILGNNGQKSSGSTKFTDKIKSEIRNSQISK